MANSDTDGNEPREEIGAIPPAVEQAGEQAFELGGEALEPAAEELANLDIPPQLELGDDDVRLPWLEGDDEGLDENRGSGSMQGLLLALLGLLAIGVIAGGIYMVMRDKPDEQLVADGGIIAAPKEPFKVKPENPGGEVVAGTGDTSFAVAEGQSRQVRIDGGEQQVGPDAAPATKPEAPAQPKAPAAPTGDGVGVQVGAYSSKDAAEAGWNALKTQYPALSGISHRVLQGQADIGTVYRLQAVPGDLAAARALCSGMKGAGLSCQVKN
jgi:hypothetical protein